MKNKELHLRIKDEKYIFNLICTKEKIRRIDKGTETFRMRTEGIDFQIEREGKLENKLQKEHVLKKGIKIGTFKELYREYNVEGYYHNFLQLNLKNKQIIIAKYVDDIESREYVAIKTKAHWYDKWDEEGMKKEDFSVKIKN